MLYSWQTNQIAFSLFLKDDTFTQRRNSKDQSLNTRSAISVAQGQSRAPAPEGWLVFCSIHVIHVLDNA
jgi:hypothetical protein